MPVSFFEARAKSTHNQHFGFVLGKWLKDPGQAPKWARAWPKSRGFRRAVRKEHKRHPTFSLSGRSDALQLIEERRQQATRGRQLEEPTTRF